MGLEELVVSMNRLGIHYTVLESGADGAILILPEYGRILGVWPHWRGENALWVNPDFLRLLEIGSKRTGGDPGWRPHVAGAPGEASPSTRRPRPWTPASMRGFPTKSGFTMENKGEVHAWKSGMLLGFRIQRKIRSLEEQEMSDMWGTKRRLRQAGYSEETTLEVSRQVPPSVWLWNLTSVPRGAEVIAGKGPCAEPGLSPLLPDRILCVEERDDGRGQLLVKSFEAQATGPQPRPPDERPGANTFRGRARFPAFPRRRPPRPQARPFSDDPLCLFREDH